MTKRRCATCLYFDPFLDDLDSAGRCRVRPPDVISGWPTVNDQDWCGAYREDAAKKAQLHRQVEEQQGATSWAGHHADHEDNYDLALDKAKKGVLA